MEILKVLLCILLVSSVVDGRKRCKRCQTPKITYICGFYGSCGYTRKTLQCNAAGIRCETVIESLFCPINTICQGYIPMTNPTCVAVTKNINCAIEIQCVNATLRRKEYYGCSGSSSECASDFILIDELVPCLGTEASWCDAGQCQNKCNDGVDNDGNGVKDACDAGCGGPGPTGEGNAPISMGCDGIGCFKRFKGWNGVVCEMYGTDTAWCSSGVCHMPNITQPNEWAPYCDYIPPTMFMACRSEGCKRTEVCVPGTLSGGTVLSDLCLLSQPAPACPDMNCGQKVAGFGGANWATCLAFLPTVQPGYCDAHGGCSVDVVETCTAGTTSHNRPFCGSGECTKACPVGGDVSDYSTVDQICYTNSEPLCPNGGVCDPTGTCKTALGVSCSVDGDCASGHCTDGVCCVVGDCGACQVCNGTCIPVEENTLDDRCDPAPCSTLVGGWWTDDEFVCGGFSEDAPYGICSAFGACRMGVEDGGCVGHHVSGPGSSSLPYIPYLDEVELGTCVSLECRSFTKCAPDNLAALVPNVCLDEGSNSSQCPSPPCKDLLAGLDGRFCQMYADDPPTGICNANGACITMATPESCSLAPRTNSIFSCGSVECVDPSLCLPATSSQGYNTAHFVCLDAPRLGKCPLGDWCSNGTCAESNCYNNITQTCICALDFCGTCGGQNGTCIGCDGVLRAMPYVMDYCGICVDPLSPSANQSCVVEAQHLSMVYEAVVLFNTSFLATGVLSGITTPEIDWIWYFGDQVLYGEQVVLLATEPTDMELVVIGYNLISSANTSAWIHVQTAAKVESMMLTTETMVGASINVWVVASGTEVVCSWEFVSKTNATQPILHLGVNNGTIALPSYGLWDANVLCNNTVSYDTAKVNVLVLSTSPVLTNIVPSLCPDDGCGCVNLEYDIFVPGSWNIPFQGHCRVNNELFEASVSYPDNVTAVVKCKNVIGSGLTNISASLFPTDAIVWYHGSLPLAFHPRPVVKTAYPNLALVGYNNVVTLTSYPGQPFVAQTGRGWLENNVSDVGAVMCRFGLVGQPYSSFSPATIVDATTIQCAVGAWTEICGTCTLPTALNPMTFAVGVSFNGGYDYSEPNSIPPMYYGQHFSKIIVVFPMSLATGTSSSVVTVVAHHWTKESNAKKCRFGNMTVDAQEESEVVHTCTVPSTLPAGLQPLSISNNGAVWMDWSQPLKLYLQPKSIRVVEPERLAGVLVPSGKLPAMKVEVLDESGLVVLTDQLLLEMKIVPGWKVRGQLTVQVENGVGVFDGIVLTLERAGKVHNITYCSLGVGCTDPIQVYAAPCPLHSTPIPTLPERCECDVGYENVGGTGVHVLEECIACPVGQYKDLIANYPCEKCRPTETTAQVGSVDFEDCTCALGMYRDADECVECVVGGFCEGGEAPPIAQDGFFPSPYDDLVFYQCTYPGACLLGGKCAPLHKGLRCSTCVDGAYLLDGRCRACNPWTRLALPFVLIVCFLLAGVMMHINVRPYDNPHYGTFRIGFVFLQIISYYARINIPWPETMVVFYRSLGLFNLQVELASPECALGFTITYWVKWGMLLLSPLTFVFVLGLWLGIFGIQIRYFPRTRQMPFSSYKDACIRSIILLLSAMFLPLCNGVLEIFDCRPQLDDRLYLYTAPSVQCYEENHIKAIPIALIAGVFYMIGIPVLFAVALRRWKTTKDKMKWMAKYGYLSGRFSQKVRYYELLVLMRRLGIACSVTLLAGRGALQISLAAIVMIWSLVGHLWLQPYKSKSHQHLDTMCIAVALGVLIASNMLAHETGGRYNVFVDVIVLVLVISTGVTLVGGGVREARVFVHGVKRDRLRSKALKQVEEDMHVYDDLE